MSSEMVPDLYAWIDHHMGEELCMISDGYIITHNRIWTNRGMRPYLG